MVRLGIPAESETGVGRGASLACGFGTSQLPSTVILSHCTHCLPSGTPRSDKFVTSRLPSTIIHDQYTQHRQQHAQPQPHFVNHGSPPHPFTTSGRGISIPTFKHSANTILWTHKLLLSIPSTGTNITISIEHTQLCLQTPNHDHTLITAASGLYSKPPPSTTLSRGLHPYF